MNMHKDSLCLDAVLGHHDSAGDISPFFSRWYGEISAPIKHYGRWKDCLALCSHFSVFSGTDLEYLVNRWSSEEQGAELLQTI